MHITDIMRGDSPTFSFEFFPPKTQAAAEILYQTIRDLESYMPHFVSVTYGAGGSTRDLTHDLVERIQHTTKLDPIPHLTCVCHNEEQVEAILLRYARSAIGNILALGGDRPRIQIAAVSGSAWPVSPKDIPQRRIDWLKWIISKRKWTPGPTTSLRNYFSIITTFSISANVVRSPTFISPLSRASCPLHPSTDSNASRSWPGARASRPSFCVLSNVAKTILKWS